MGADLGAEITKDVSDPSGRVDAIESDIQQARQDYIDKRVSTANEYLDLLRGAKSRVSDLLAAHRGKAYMPSGLTSKLEDLKSTIDSEIQQTKSERESVKKV
jgi:hypothetical protein